MSAKPHIAFVYDWFDTPVGGAERVLQMLHVAFPDAPWYTSHIDPKVAPWAKGWDIRTSFMQKFPLWFRRNRILSLSFLPFAFESFDLSEYDAVVSITSAFAKGIVTRTQTRHICYLLTPPRWMYNFQKPPSTGHAIFNFQILRRFEMRVRGYLQRWDYISAQRVDEFISISQDVAKRCKEYYGRDSEVLYPPFDKQYWGRLSKLQDKNSLRTLSLRDPTKSWSWQSHTIRLLRRDFVPPRNDIEDNVGPPIQHSARADNPFFLMVSRLEPYKKVGLAIEGYAKFRIQKQKGSFLSTKLEVNSQLEMTKEEIKLIIVGTGSQKKKLQTLARRLQIEEDIVWLEKVSDEDLAWLYAHCRAFIMPQEEDFGYVACEAAACGAPIVAYAHGGQVEILQDYPKKALFEAQTVDSLVSALEKISLFKYNAQTYENRNLRGGSGDSFVATLTQKITKAV